MQALKKVRYLKFPKLSRTEKVSELSQAELGILIFELKPSCWIFLRIAFFAQNFFFLDITNFWTRKSVILRKKIFTKQKTENRVYKVQNPIENECKGNKK